MSLIWRGRPPRPGRLAELRELLGLPQLGVDGLDSLKVEDGFDLSVLQGRLAELGHLTVGRATSADVEAAWALHQRAEWGSWEEDDPRLSIGQAEHTSFRSSR